MVVGVKARLMSDRARPCRGGSITSIERASGLYPSQAGSMERATPSEEKRWGFLSTLRTSA
jgi:hypothetical protein